MITESKILVPIYNTYLHIIFTDNINEVDDKYNLYPASNEYNGSAWAVGGHIYVAYLTKDITPQLVCHEAKHVVNMIFEFLCIDLDVKNDEAECYLLAWVVERVYEKWKIVKKKFVIS